MSEKKDKRWRSFATICYPESCPDNFIQLLQDEHIPFFVSPLHDSDVTDDGVLKKAHYHVLVIFDGNKSFEQLDKIRSLIGGVGMEFPRSNKGYARYLCHLDDKDKAQYSVSDVVANMLDYYSYCTNPDDKYQTTCDIMDFIDANNMTSYSDLLRFCRRENMMWFRHLCDTHSYVIKEYQKSLAFSNKK